jgi:hypothetical protein
MALALVECIPQCCCHWLRIDVTLSCTVFAGFKAAGVCMCLLQLQLVWLRVLRTILVMHVSFPAGALLLLRSCGWRTIAALSLLNNWG